MLPEVRVPVSKHQYHDSECGGNEWETDRLALHNGSEYTPRASSRPSSVNVARHLEIAGSG
jgi:hypothetical protein